MKKVAFYTLGCKVNQYETEAMLEMFEKNGYENVPSEDYADVYVINTCTVTHMSDRKSRQYIRFYNSCRRMLFSDFTRGNLGYRRCKPSNGDK